MSTNFYVARHATDTVKTASVKNLRADTYDARGAFRLLVALNDIEPLRNGNWKISITNYDGSKTVQKNLHWEDLTMHLTMFLTAEDISSILN